MQNRLHVSRVALAALCVLAFSSSADAQARAAAAPAPRGPAPSHGVRPKRMVIRGVMVIEGNGTPAEGPKDVVIEGNQITQIVALDPVAMRDGTARRPPTGDAEIDGTGKYVMPGLINIHGHVQDERSGIPQPLDYQLKLWLGMGITTVRDVSSETAKTLQLRARSLAGEIAAPRLYVYARYAFMPIPQK